MDDKVYIEEFKELQHSDGAIVEPLSSKPQSQRVADVKNKHLETHQEHTLCMSLA